MDVFFLAKWIAKLILPPAGNFLLAVVGWLLLRTGLRWLGHILLALSLLSLVAFTLPVVSDYILNSLEYYPALDPEQPVKVSADAIVVLGMGRYQDAPEYGGDTVSVGSLERLRYGAYLQRRTGLPLLLSGGFYHAREKSEAQLMAQVLEDEFQVAVRWMDNKSRNTQENALYSEKILRANGVTRIYLVTHAWHMPRAMAAFERVGLDAIAAPMGFAAPAVVSVGLKGFVPDAGAFRDSVYALHELLGLVWYRLRYSGLGN